MAVTSTSTVLDDEGEYYQRVTNQEIFLLEAAFFFSFFFLQKFNILPSSFKRFRPGVSNIWNGTEGVSIRIHFIVGVSVSESSLVLHFQKGGRQRGVAHGRRSTVRRHH